MLIKTLQRHVFAELLRTFCVASLCLLTIILIGRGLQLSGMLVGLSLGFSDTIMLFFYMSPMFLLIVIPLSCMVSIFLSFLRMSTDRELVALKSGGISLYQLLPAPMFFATLCMLTTLLVSLYGVSWGMEKFRSNILEIARTRANVNIQPGVFNQDIFGLTLFARKVDPVTGQLQQIIFEDTAHAQGTRVTILAPTGSILTDQNRGELVFNLKNGHIYRLNKTQLSVLEFKDYNVRLNMEKIIADSGGLLGDIRPKEMSWKELLRIRAEEPDHPFYKKTINEIQKRMALPVACLILALFALPLACSFEGAKQQLGLFIALLMFLVYYTLFSFGVSMADKGVLPVILGNWLSNIIFGGLAVAGMYFTAHEHSLKIWDVINALKKPILRGIEHYSKKTDSDKNSKEGRS